MEARRGGQESFASQRVLSRCDTHCREKKVKTIPRVQARECRVCSSTGVFFRRLGDENAMGHYYHPHKNILTLNTRYQATPTVRPVSSIPTSRSSHAAEKPPTTHHVRRSVALRRVTKGSSVTSESETTPRGPSSAVMVIYA